MAIELHIDRGLKDGAEIFFFPENSIYFRIDKGPMEYSFDLESPEILQLLHRCQRDNIEICLGSVPFKSKNGIENAMVWLTPEGAEKVYSKIHLFDVEVEGHKPVRESDDFYAGSEPRILERRGWKFGLSICYDLRFSELYSRYALENVDVLLIPSAFLVPTGEAHWHILNRARAIENQVYVIAAAQGGTHAGVRGGSRSTHGHSMVVDPWGRILAESQSSGETPVVELHPSVLSKVRQQIPMANHRKLLKRS